MFNVGKEDWGFTSFMHLLNLNDTTQGYIIDAILIVEAYHERNYRNKSSFIGLNTLTRKRLLNPPLNPKSTPFAGEEPWVKGWMSYWSRIMSRNHLSKRLVGFVLYILNKYSGENHERKDKYGMNYVYVSCKHISQNPNENHFLSFIGIPKTLFRWPNK